MEIDEEKGVAPMPEADNGTPEIVEAIPENFSPVETPEQTETPPEEKITSPCGETFNPEIHVSPKSITKNGHFRKKKNAPKIEETEIPPENPTTAESAETVVENANVHATAETITFLFVQFGIFIFGKNFKPENKNETDGLVSTLEVYLAQKGIDDIPPGVAVCIAFGGYTIAKMRHEECRKRGLGIFAYIKNKISSFILWIKTRRALKNA